MAWLLWFAGAAIVLGAGLVQTPFDKIVKLAESQNQLIIFYKSPGGTSAAAETVDAKIAEVLKHSKKAFKKVAPELPQLHFRICDGNLPENTVSWSTSSFSNGAYIFTSIPGEGVVRYTGPKSVKGLASLARSKFLSHNPADVRTFTDEDDFWDLMDMSEDPLPILAFFVSLKCTTCPRVLPGFRVAASAYAGQKGAIFVEVDCEKDVAREFCARQKAKTMPYALTLFTGEDKVRMPLRNGVDVPSFHMYTVLLSAHGVAAKEPTKLGQVKLKGVKSAKKPLGAEADSSANSEEREAVGAGQASSDSSGEDDQSGANSGSEGSSSGGGGGGGGKKKGKGRKRRRKNNKQKGG
jgi:uncharacterized membrane protein YgcG